MNVEEVDVLVIGGGPAGACYAATVARCGYAVRVVEGKNFPRHHIGESLLAASMPLLRDLGVMPSLEREGFLPKTGSMFVWNHQEIGLAMPAPCRAFQVPRARFDEILLGHARSCGARVWEGQWVKSVSTSDDDELVLVRSDGDQGQVRHHARLVVDATGLFQSLPRKEGLPVRVIGPPRIAVSAYYRGAGRLSGFHATNVISEATRDGWLWFIPLSEELTSVGFVGDADDLDISPAAHLDAQIGTSTVVRRLLDEAVPQRRPRLLRYTNHIVESPLWQHRRAIIGDSAFFVDPLFSTGVHGGLFTATMAACATVGVLSGAVSEKAAADWYDRQARRHHARVQHTIDLLYGIHHGASRFWRSRDLCGMSPADAERFATNLGALGTDLFRCTFSHSLLPIPPNLQALLGEFKGQPRACAPPPGVAAVCLAPGVTVREDLIRRKDRVIPGYVLSHERNRRFPASVPRGDPAEPVLCDLRTGGIPAAAWVDDPRRTTFVGLLFSAQLVNPARGLMGGKR